MSYSQTLLNDIMDAAVVTVKTVAAFGDRVYFPPPETSQIEGPWAYLEYGPAEIEQASDEVIVHTITITVCMPMKGNYAGGVSTGGEYTGAIQTAFAVHRAFYADVMVAGEAAVGTPGTISKPFFLQYGETRTIACTLTMMLVTSEDVSALVST